MIQTLLRNAFGVGAQYQYERTEYPWGAVHFYLSLKDEALICPQCGCMDDVIRVAVHRVDGMFREELAPVTE